MKIMKCLGGIMGGGGLKSVREHRSSESQQRKPQLNTDRLSGHIKSSQSAWSTPDETKTPELFHWSLSWLQRNLQRATMMTICRRSCGNVPPSRGAHVAPTFPPPGSSCSACSFCHSSSNTPSWSPSTTGWRTGRHMSSWPRSKPQLETAPLFRWEAVRSPLTGLVVIKWPFVPVSLWHDVFLSDWHFLDEEIESFWTLF